MPKLTCPNGHVLDLSGVPVPDEYFYGETSRWDEIVAAQVQALAADPTGDPGRMTEILSDALAARVKNFYRCGGCGALVFPAEDPPAGYVPMVAEDG